MLYIGLVVGAFLGICLSIIILVIVKDLIIKVRSEEEPAAVLDQQGSETLPSLFSSSLPGNKRNGHVM